MASIRKRGNSYLLVVSMGYDFDGKRRKPQQKTVHPPDDLTPKAKEKWIEGKAALFEQQLQVRRKKKKKQNVADEETTQKLIAALEEESVKYETYFKLIIATGMRRGECCGLKWCDVNFKEKSIHIWRNVVKVTGEDIIVKEPKTTAGDRYIYFSAEMASLLKEYRKFCQQETETCDERELTPDGYIFRRHGLELPMTPSSFTWRFKLILKKHGLPENLDIHSLRHTAASLMIAGGADVATVSGLLGHSQVSATLDIYTHAFDDKKKAASAVLQESLDIIVNAVQKRLLPLLNCRAHPLVSPAV